MRPIVAAFAFILVAGLANAQTDRGTISGKVVREKPAGPVVDAIIKFTLERSPAGFRKTTKSRPPDGRFSDEMPQGWVLISVFKKEADGSIWVGKDRVKVDTNYGASIPEIKLVKGEAGSTPPSEQQAAASTVQGTLSNGSLPVAGFISVNDATTGDEVASASVGGDGRFVLQLPANRQYVFTGMADGHEARMLVVTVRGSGRIDLPLGP